VKERGNSIFVSFINYFRYVKKEEMDGICSTYGKEYR
jgi:hypothetical protein